MIACQPKPDVLMPAFLERVWQSADVRRQIEASAKTTNGTFKVNQQDLAHVRLPLPPMPLRRRFSEVVAPVDGAAKLMKDELDFADTLFASLQERAFRGGCEPRPHGPRRVAGMTAMPSRRR